MSRKAQSFEISYYQDYISVELATALLRRATDVEGVDGLKRIGAGGGLETSDALRFLCHVYRDSKAKLGEVLQQRQQDRKFIDERVRACYKFNQEYNRDILHKEYKTIIGLEDADGRVVIGPLHSDYYRAKAGAKKVAPIPSFLQGPHVTLFGPPDSAKMAVNAMNAYHRKLKEEPTIVSEILKTCDYSPKWGADDEDSKTPLHADLIDSAVNLTACFDKTIKVVDKENGKTYELAKEKLSAPIKRFPGLALPSTFLFYQENPIPLHVYDFAIHLFHNWHNPEALVFYVPKLENEEEARYIHHMISVAEAEVQRLHPEYKLGTVRLMIVLENPRAILRAHEIMDALYPYFVGASLGWHDYLGSTARLFKEDGNYRIPVKADPDIVIKYIKASHDLLANVVGSRGGIQVGGMYGILPLTNELKSESFQVTIKGFIKDVITQMKRNLTGYWVAHPDFVRLGIAMVEAWKQYAKGNTAPLFELVKELLHEKYHDEIVRFIEGKDIQGLNCEDPNYVRALLVADIKESDFIANNHPDEIRYNVFQSLQYLTDWLSGNGCVALPSIVNGVPVRVMDDLATAERSRWEVWHEIYHGRFAVEDFLKIAHEELHFIRKDLSNDKKIVQVKWDERTDKWYPIAMQLMLQLMTDPNPVEFATELLMPFTVDEIRNADDPWRKVQELDPHKYRLTEYVGRFHYYFERCGVMSFATKMASCVVQDNSIAEKQIKNFTKSEIIEAASFHGNIGEAKKTLDKMAAAEQKLVFDEEQSIKEELKLLGQKYLAKFGVKFLISAKGKTGKELLMALKQRIENSESQELTNAREALWQITQKRIVENPLDQTIETIAQLRQKHNISGLQLTVSDCLSERSLQTIAAGEAIEETTWFELASLSKTFASAFAIEYFKKKNISLDTCVNDLLATTQSDFRIQSDENPAWADRVTIKHLMNHSALNMHYVNGVPANKKLPAILDLLRGKALDYKPVCAIHLPGTKFQYSGGGFLVLEHLIESLENKSSITLANEFLRQQKLKQISFDIEGELHAKIAVGYFDEIKNGTKVVPGGRYKFPSFAAGMLGTSRDTTRFLQILSSAYQQLDGCEHVSHDTAVEMLHGVDLGSQQFMGCKMGVGVFVAEAGENKIAIHQGANEGFRALFFYCFAGPDIGKGFTLFCNADNSGVLFNAEVAQVLIQHLNIRGVDFTKINSKINLDTITQEQKVNLGYKALVFDAFHPALPEEIIRVGKPDALALQNVLVDAEILYVSNQRFARAENLLSPFEPTFDPQLFGKQGKIMDSWESARHNLLGADTLQVKLKNSASIKYIYLSTKFHDGNQSPLISIFGFDGNKWWPIIENTTMDGHSEKKIALKTATPEFEQIKIQMSPDGGLSRVYLYGELPQSESSEYETADKAKCRRYIDVIPKTKKPMTIAYHPGANEIKQNLAATKEPRNILSQAFGAKLIRATNEHYGPAVQVISPFVPLNMFDGLESARSRKPGHFEEVVLELAKPHIIQKIEMDFTFFVNNNPLEITVDGLHNGEWAPLVTKTNVKAFAGNKKMFALKNNKEISQILVRTYPDGGINRIKCY